MFTNNKKVPAFIQVLDDNDSLSSQRNAFNLPRDSIYLCGHSLGPMPHQIPNEIDALLNEWQEQGVSAWNKSNWLHLPEILAAEIASVIGANRDEMMVADNTTINLFKLLIAGLHIKKNKTTILTDHDNFPADLYIAESLTKLFPQVKMIHCDSHEIAKHLNNDVAILMLTHSHFRTSELYDLKKITDLAHANDSLVLFDLSHSVGILPIKLNDAKVDMAVGCTYKYLNGGPGSPAFLFVAKAHHASMHNPIQGWLGHAAPFDFEKKYRNARGMKQFLTGTPSPLAMRALSASLALFKSTTIEAIRKKSQQLGDLFIELLNDTCAELTLLSPRAANLRGGHIAYAHENAYAISGALKEKGVICDFRTPNAIRFGMSALYLSYQDIWQSTEILYEVLHKKMYQAPHFSIINGVT